MRLFSRGGEALRALEEEEQEGDEEEAGMMAWLGVLTLLFLRG